MAEGSTAIIRAYKLGGESLPLSGLELAKQQLVGKHAADAAAAALAAASRLEATKVLLQKLMADRKAQRDEEKRQKDEKRRFPGNQGGSPEPETHSGSQSSPS
jgi:hypothetical protein